jgi:cephalosporin hydroxylase
LRALSASVPGTCKLAAVPSVKPFVYLVRDEAYTFRRLVNRTLFRRRLHGDAVERFTEVYYEGALFGETRADTRWLGVRTDKCPLDLWIYQEVLHELRPDLIIETGTAFGGSALYFASMCDLLDHGRVLTIDVQPQEDRPEHPRIEYYAGSSVAPETVEHARHAAEGAETVLVVLDSDHRKEHVLEELRLYAPLVTPGSYLVVEDTILNGHPVSPEFGPGPMEATEEFVRENPDFTSDRRREKLYLTFNPKGYLRRAS